MAQEQWALDQLEAGVAFDEIFRKILEGNDSVAALGIGASLCLAYPGVSLGAAFPLVTCPYLWEWEIERVVQEGTPLNEMGNWYQDRMQLNAVRALNQKPHRKSDIRQLILYFVFSGDAELVEKFVESIRSFPERLPISYEEKKNNLEQMAALREKMVLFAEQADPQNLKTAPTNDGEHTQIWIEPPSLQKEEYRAQQEAHDQRNQWLSVALWANKSLETGDINEQLSLADALAKARAWDKSDLFDAQTHPFDDYHRAAAVAGTAYVAAKYCPPEAWTDELASWCLDVMERAATGPEVDDRFTVRSALLLMNPAVFATHGYAALLARGYEVDRCQVGLLNLATDSLEGVQLAVVASAKDYAADRREFYWVLLDLMLQQCVVHREEIPNYHSIRWTQSEVERIFALLDRAETAFRSKDPLVLPTIPMPWVKDAKNATAPRRMRRDMAGYMRNDMVFRWDIAGKILPHICLESVLSEADRRAQMLKLISEFLELTFQEILPPFAKSKREHGSNTPYEWVFAVSAWCGKVYTHLTLDEARRVILAPIWAQHSDTALLIMQSLMRTFMIRALLTPPEISDEHIALWSEMAEWVFANPEWTRDGRGNYLDREFTSCALTLLFCAAGDFSPLICGVDPGWPHLGKFLPILERAIREFGTNETLYHAVITFLKRGGIDLLPEPALAWLHEVVSNKKGDQKFWSSNGENTVELLKQVISQKSTVLIAEHRKLITSIADILTDDGVRGAGFLQQELMRAV